MQIRFKKRATKDHIAIVVYYYNIASSSESESLNNDFGGKFYPGEAKPAKPKACFQSDSLLHLVEFTDNQHVIITSS